MSVTTRSQWKEIYNNFENDVCRSCCASILSSNIMSMPQPIPYVGSKFKTSEQKLMFVGIESYSNDLRENCSDVTYSTFLKKDEYETQDKSFWNWVTRIRSPFWYWVKKITSEIFETKTPEELQEAFSKIAYSNLHKCEARRYPKNKENPNLAKIMDESSYQIIDNLSENCISKAKWIYKEIEALDAKNIIVFAGTEKNNLARIFLNYAKTEPLEKIETKIFPLKNEQWKKGQCKNYYLVNLQDGNRRFIVTNHPGGTRTAVRDRIIKIVKENLRGKPWSMPKG